jgi:hypothetical protein
MALEQIIGQVRFEASFLGTINFDETQILNKTYSISALYYEESLASFLDGMGTCC